MIDRSLSMTRRTLVGGTALAVVASTIPLSAIAATNNKEALMTDPTSKYPRPPFNHQQQPWPGLASKMDPVPDHGEESYMGSGRLEGRKALITGGDSGMGRAAAIAYAREGADVAINYLPAEEEDAKQVIDIIEKAGRKAVALPGDLRDKDFCAQLVEDTVAALGGLDIIVNNAARQQTRASLADIRNDEDKHLCDFPAHQSRFGTFEARINDYSNNVGASL